MNIFNNVNDLLFALEVFAQMLGLAGTIIIVKKVTSSNLKDTVGKIRTKYEVSEYEAINEIMTKYRNIKMGTACLALSYFCQLIKIAITSMDKWVIFILCISL